MASVLNMLTMVLLAASAALAADPLPIIPGAAGFGIDTPAGSGRHVLDSQLPPDWDKHLVGWWNFNDGTTKSTAGDAVGKLEGDAKLIDRADGKALHLDGSGLLNLAHAEGYMEPKGSFTAMAWVKTETLGGTLIGCSMSAGRYWNLQHVKWGDSGKWSLNVGQEKEKNHSEFRGSQTTGVWRLVSGVYDGTTGRIRLYINGIQVHNGWNREVKGLEASRSSALSAGKGLKGALDDIMLFDAALSEAEIRAIHVNQCRSYFDAPADVYRVTNRNDSGPGSLREGLESQNGARTIVFEVSGNISLKTTLVLRAQKNSWLTIAGETAPSPGITLKDNGMNVGSGCHDILIRHIRIRPGDTPLGGVLKDGWTALDADGPGTVFSRPLKDPPGAHTGIGQHHLKAIWWNKERLLLPEKTEGLKREEIVANLKQGQFYWADGVVYVNVGQSPDQGELAYAKSKGTGNPLNLGQRTHDIVVDHVTVTWGGDMNMTVLGNQHVTIRNCLNAEALHSPLHPKGPHSRGVLVSDYTQGKAGNICLLGNVFAFNMARNPTVDTVDNTMVANNLMVACNVAIRVQAFDALTHRVFGPQFRAAFVGNVIERANVPLQGRVVGKPENDHKNHIYLSPDNMMNGKTFASADEIWKQVDNMTWSAASRPLEICRAQTLPVTVPGLTIKPAQEVKEWVLAHAGARPADRDPVDKRIIENIRTGQGKLPIESQREVGGWPDLAENHRTLTLPANPYADDNGDGYTNLENWLHGYAADVEGAKQ